MAPKGELRCGDCRYSATGCSSTYCCEFHRPRVVDPEDPPCEWFAPKDRIEGGKMKGFTASIGGALRKASRKIVAWKKEFIGTCIDNPFDDLETLENVIDNATEIARDAFLSSCDVPGEMLQGMQEYPHDYGFYRSGHDGTTVYFFTHSAIEHFFS